MASRFWVGGGSSANWSATPPTNWSATSGGVGNASVPGATDDVFFDGVGILAQSASTLSANITVQSVDFTGYTGTLTHNAAVTLTIGGTTVVCKFSAGMTYTRGSATSALSFTATSGTVTLTSAGKTLGNITRSGIGGGLTLADALSSAGTLTVSGGSFDAAGFTVTLVAFNGSSSSTRSITMGAGTWTITGNAATVWTTSTQTALTFSAGTVEFNYSGSTGSRAIICAGSGTGIVRPLIRVTAGSDTIAAGATVITATDLDFTGFTGTLTGSGALRVSGNLTMGAGMTVTHTGILALDGTATGKLVTTNGVALTFGLNIGGVGGAWTLADNFLTTGTINPTAGTFDAGGFTVTAAIFLVSSATAKTVTMGAGTWFITGNAATVWSTSTNTGLTFNAGTVEFVYSGGTGTRTISSSVSGAGVARPLMRFTAGSDIVSAGTANMTATDLDFTGFTGTLAGSGNIFVTGNLTLVAGQATPTFSGTISFQASVAGKLFTTAAKSLVCTVQVTGTAGVTLNGNLITTKGLLVTAGMIDAAGYTVTALTFATSGVAVKTITMGSGLWTITGSSASVWNTANGGVVTLTSGTVQFTYAGGVGTRSIAGRLANRQSMLFVSGTDTVDIATTTGVNDLDFTGFGGTLSGSGTTLDVAGNLTFVAGQATPTFDGTITMSSTTTGKLFTTADKPFVCNFSFNGIGGGWTQVGAFLTTGSFFMPAGTYDVNGNTFQAGAFDLNSSGLTRSFTMLSGTLRVTAPGLCFSFFQNLTLTLNLGTTTLEIDTTNDPTGAYLFQGGNSFVTLPDIHLVGPGDASISFYGFSSFKEFKNDIPRVVLDFVGGGAQIETFSVAGTAGNLVTLTGSIGNVLTNTGLAKVVTDYLDISDITASPVYDWYVGLHSTDNGGNSGWIFNTPQSKHAMGAILGM